MQYVIAIIGFVTIVSLAVFAVVHRKPSVMHAPTPMHCPDALDRSMECVGDDQRVYICVKEYGDEQLDIFCAVRTP